MIDFGDNSNVQGEQFTDVVQIAGLTVSRNIFLLFAKC